MGMKSEMWKMKEKMIKRIDSAKIFNWMKKNKKNIIIRREKRKKRVEKNEVRVSSKKNKGEGKAMMTRKEK